MTTIAIVRESDLPNSKTYRAVAGARESVGSTPGKALDGLIDLLDEGDSGTLVIVQHLRPDRFFTEEQQERMGELMSRWRTARDAGETLTPAEEAELESLVEEEVQAARRRAQVALAELEK